MQRQGAVSVCLRSCSWCRKQQALDWPPSACLCCMMQWQAAAVVYLHGCVRRRKQQALHHCLAACLSCHVERQVTVVLRLHGCSRCRKQQLGEDSCICHARRYMEQIGAAVQLCRSQGSRQVCLLLQRGLVEPAAQCNSDGVSARRWMHQMQHQALLPAPNAPPGAGRLPSGASRFQASPLHAASIQFVSSSEGAKSSTLTLLRQPPPTAGRSAAGSHPTWLAGQSDPRVLGVQ